jgi:hypothetical protein
MKRNTSFIILKLNYVIKIVHDYLKFLYHIQAIALRDMCNHC